MRYLKHTVETCVACYSDISEPQLVSKKLAFAIVVVIVLLVAIIFAGQIVSALTSALGSMWSKIILLAVVLGLALLIYFVRVRNYRYMFYYERNAQVFDPRFDEMVDIEYDEPYGTFIVKLGVANKGKLKEKVLYDELVALAAPENKADYVDLPTDSYTSGRKKTAHILVYERNGEKRGILFHPDAKLVSCMQQVLSEKSDETHE